eukprot:4170884-Amphidinium_carterae.1
MPFCWGHGVEFPHNAIRAAPNRLFNQWHWCCRHRVWGAQSRAKIGATAAMSMNRAQRPLR